MPGVSTQILPFAFLSLGSTVPQVLIRAVPPSRANVRWGKVNVQGPAFSICPAPSGPVVTGKVRWERFSDWPVPRSSQAHCPSIFLAELSCRNTISHNPLVLV